MKAYDSSVFAVQSSVWTVRLSTSLQGHCSWPQRLHKHRGRYFGLCPYSCWTRWASKSSSSSLGEIQPNSPVRRGQFQNLSISYPGNHYKTAPVQRWSQSQNSSFSQSKVAFLFRMYIFIQFKVPSWISGVVNEPLRGLLKAEEVWNLSAECWRCFDELKSRFTCPLVLAYTTTELHLTARLMLLWRRWC